MADEYEMLYDEWAEKFNPLLDKYGNLQEFYSLSKEQIESFGGINHVWTILQSDGSSDDDRDFIVTGLHWVNRDSYVVTKVPWSTPDMDIVIPIDDSGWEEGL